MVVGIGLFSIQARPLALVQWHCSYLLTNLLQCCDGSVTLYGKSRRTKRHFWQFLRVLDLGRVSLLLKKLLTYGNPLFCFSASL